MAEDFDVEAMLEAPYNKNSSNGITLSSEHQIKEEDCEKKHERSRSRDHRERRRSSSKSRSHERKKRRSRSRDRRSRSRDRRSRSRDRRSRSRERRKRSRSRERRYKRSKDRSRSRDRRRRSRSRDRRSRYDDRHSRRSSSYYREDRILEEADRRTVFCMQLSSRVGPRDLEDFFAQAGKVREVRLIMDNKTRKHKGIAYIEFYDSTAIPNALRLNGEKICGYPITIQPTNAEKNKSVAPPSNGHSTTGAPIPAPVAKKPIVHEPLRLYVGSLHFNVNEDMLRSIFEPFGTVTKIELMRDADTFRSKGYGFITFANSADAKKALEQMNHFELVGRPMKVNHVAERSSDVSSSSGQTLDNDELGDRSGIDLGAKGRLQLMAKLAQGTGIELPKAVVNALNQYTSGNNHTTAVENAESIPIATQCFMLTNLFDPETEEDEDWPEVIKEEVLSECRLHGGAVHIFVDTASKGNVYVKAISIAAAHKIINVLHGRYFSGKMVMASYVPASQYHCLFPDSLNQIQPL